ncbi:MAG: MBOAT family protein [Clostridiales bacterium]|nr:MBOAT family protein [Clostridiales bacterium]
MWWRPEFIILILISSFINYFLSGCINVSDSNKFRKFFLILNLLSNFGILFVFKYAVFVNKSFMELYEYLGKEYPISDFDIILPMGISFFTFQAAGYTIDVYKRRIKPELNFFKFMLYLMFFPQLVAGPIERAENLMGQLFSRHKFNSVNISIGIKFMIMGYFKKVVIADRAAILVDTVYNSTEDFGGIAIIIATLFFTFQIYCDFSGYSDIAIGCAKTFGIDLMKNFNRPYFSVSIKDFWRNWHISLSSWLKDYVYIPMGGSRCILIRKYFNLMVTFLLSGLWHGANWTFVLWGGLHGFYQVIGDLKNKIFKTDRPQFFLLTFFRIIITFTLVSFAWIFFRANTISDAFYIIKNISSDFNNVTNAQYMYELLNSMGLSIYEILICLCSILFLIMVELFERKTVIHYKLNSIPFILRFIFYYVVVIAILALGVFGNDKQFIYFQF